MSFGQLYEEHYLRNKRGQAHLSASARVPGLTEELHSPAFCATGIQSQKVAWEGSGFVKQKPPFSMEELQTGPTWQDSGLQKSLQGCHNFLLLLVSPDSVSKGLFLLIWLQPFSLMHELLGVKTLPTSPCQNPD